MFFKGFSGLSQKPGSLLTDTKLTDQFLVGSRVLALKVVEHSAALTNKLQKASAAVVIFAVGLEMTAKLVDALSKKRYLNLSGSCVFSACRVLLEDVFFDFGCKCHGLSPITSS
jgi:hypothetical protein